MYFVGTGLLSFLLGIHSVDELTRSPFLDHIFENMVVMEAVKRCAAQTKPTELYFYRTLKGLEVDLLIESVGKLEAYEIKWTQSPDKSLSSSLQILAQEHPIHKMSILAPIESSFPVAQGILASPWHTVATQLRPT